MVKRNMMPKEKIDIVLKHGYVYEPSYVLDNLNTNIAKQYHLNRGHLKTYYSPNAVKNIASKFTKTDANLKDNYFIKVKSGKVIDRITWNDVYDLSIDKLTQRLSL
jgi:hypothetical protein